MSHNNEDLINQLKKATILMSEEQAQANATPIQASTPPASQPYFKNALHEFHPEWASVYSDRLLKTYQYFFDKGCAAVHEETKKVDSHAEALSDARKVIFSFNFFGVVVTLYRCD